MDKIISNVYQILKETNHLIEAEEKIQQYMYEVFSSLVADVFTCINQVVKEKKQEEGWKVKRTDSKTVQFLFGPVTYRHTLMEDEHGNSHYPFDEWLGIRSYQRQSPLVEVKVAEIASACTYRETAKILKEWTPVNLSHQTVKRIVGQVGKAQAQEDQARVKELEEAKELPEGKKVDFLYAEADGIFIRSTKKKTGMEVYHAILHEGWETNGKRVSLKNPKVILTTESIVAFWDEVQTMAATHYSLEQTRVITNSDGGKGYTAERFQEAFSQSKYPVLNQLDSYHVFQGLNRAIGAKKSEYKDAIQKALKEHNLDEFTLWMDTYESTLEDPQKIKKVKEFRRYILGNWDRMFDWREKIEHLPENARNLGAMESNQRHISFRMKKRGMHWSKDGAKAMVKIKQGMLNQTLREAYLKQQHRGVRAQREAKKIVKISSLLHQQTSPSKGVKRGSISLYAAHSSAMGQLKKMLQ